MSAVKLFRSLCRDLPRWYLASAAAIVLLASVYRFWSLDSQSLWADELWGVMACSKGSWMAMVHNLVFHDNHPPGYQTILYFVMEWFSRSDFMIRAPSAVSGVLAVVATLFIARKLFGYTTALVAGLLVAGSHQAIYYSQEARAYSPLMLACLLSTFCFIQVFIRRRFTPFSVLAFAFSATITLYLHYVGVVFVLCLALVVPLALYRSVNRAELFQAAVFGFGIPLILYFKWIPVMIHHMTNTHEYWASKPDLGMLRESYQLMLGNSPYLFYPQAMAVVGVLALCLRSLIQHEDEEICRIRALLIFVSIVPVMVFYLKSAMSQSIYTHRHFIFVIPFVALITADFVSVAGAQIKTHYLRLCFYTALLMAGISAQYVANRDAHTKLALQDFRGASELVAGDTGFVSGISQNKSAVMASHDFFYHYLWANQVGVPAYNSLSLSSNPSGLIQALIDSRPEQVYFLQVETTRNAEAERMFELAYTTREDHPLAGVQVTKFSNPTPVFSPPENLTRL